MIGRAKAFGVVLALGILVTVLILLSWARSARIIESAVDNPRSTLSAADVDAIESYIYSAWYSRPPWAKNDPELVRRLVVAAADRAESNDVELFHVVLEAYAARPARWKALEQEVVDRVNRQTKRSYYLFSEMRLASSKPDLARVDLLNIAQGDNFPLIVALVIEASDELQPSHPFVATLQNRTDLPPETVDLINRRFSSRGEKDVDEAPPAFGRESVGH